MQCCTPHPHLALLSNASMSTEFVFFARLGAFIFSDTSVRSSSLIKASLMLHQTRSASSDVSVLLPLCES
eukprot:6471799-Amphidinium_carterae.1